MLKLIEVTRSRTGWTVRRILEHLRLTRSRYYDWKRRAEDQLLEDVLLLDSPHVIKSCVDLALRNAGFGRYLRPGKSTAMAVSEAAVS